MSQPNRCPECGAIAREEQTNSYPADYVATCGARCYLAPFGGWTWNTTYTHLGCALRQARQWQMAAICEKQAREREDRQHRKRLGDLLGLHKHGDETEVSWDYIMSMVVTLVDIERAARAVDLKGESPHATT